MASNSESYPISSSSRQKLSAFLYKDKSEGETETSPSKFRTPSKASKPNYGDKENQKSWVNGVVEPGSSQPGRDNFSSETKEAKPAKEYPTTPANRLPLADLVSNTEDAFKQAPGQECTPVDHVIWQHVPASSSSDATSQTSASRLKRRHSSTPTSSPLTGNSGNAKEPFDLQKFQALLRTPQEDVATDLWNSYVGKSTLSGSEACPPPRFANLLSSSPHTPASAGTNQPSSGLKRSTSCAADWPTSNAKRRRMWKGDASAGRGIFSRTRSNILDSGESKSSRINNLLEKIEKSLQKPPKRQTLGPSSSSPLPMRYQSRSPSPVRRTTRVSDGTDEANKREGDVHDFSKTHGVPYQEASSSDYGSDDLDDELLEFAEDSVRPRQVLADSRDNAEPLNSRSNACSPPNNNGQQQSFGVAYPSLPDLKIPALCENTMNMNDTDDADEFGDNNEAFWNDIQANYDEKQEQKSSPVRYQDSGVHNSAVDTAGPLKNKGQSTDNLVSQKTSSDDEFDDDEFDIEAIEQSMSVMQPAQSESNQVCYP